MDRIGPIRPVLTNQINMAYMGMQEYLHNQMFLEQEKVLSVGWTTRVRFGYLEDMALPLVHHEQFRFDIIV
jgi:hypothetical protein